ncbi:MAG: hypothetical protein WAO56_00115 [Miniphocaeibacter sp.]|uniref:hypothetical protein n=1 Tax=Miniphocaeibacter sp. TaxID=3100973 RepID=UPI0017DBDE02|nr:hypothetical protein [Gallicola sp.]
MNYNLGSLFEILKNIVFFLGVILQFVAASWVQKDIKTKDPTERIMWFLGVFMAPFMAGLLVYLVVKARRSEKLDSSELEVVPKKTGISNIIVIFTTIMLIVSLIYIATLSYSNYKMYEELERYNVEMQMFEEMQ